MGLRVSIVLLIHNAFLRRKAWEIFSPSKRTAAATAAGASCPSTPGGNGSSCSGDASTEDAAGAFVAPCLRPAPPLEQKQQQQQQQLLRLKADAHAPCCCQSGEEDGRGEASEGHSGMDYQQQQHRMPRNHYACPGADFPAAAAQRSAKDANDCNAASAAAAPDGSHGGSGAAAAGCDAARPCPPLTALQVGRGAALPEAAAAVAAGLSPAAAASLSAVLAAAPSAGLLPYKSPIRRRTTRVKVGGVGALLEWAMKGRLGEVMCALAGRFRPAAWSYVVDSGPWYLDVGPHTVCASQVLTLCRPASLPSAAFCQNVVPLRMHPSSGRSPGRSLSS